MTCLMFLGWMHLIAFTDSKGSFCFSHSPITVGQPSTKSAHNSCKSSIAKCLAAASNTDGAQVVIQTCTGAANQKWVFTGGSVRVFGDKCLDVTEGINQDGTKLQIWTCTATGSINQSWYYNKWDNNLSWTGRGKCVDLTDGNQADGNRVSLVLIGFLCTSKLTSVNCRSKFGAVPSRTPTKSGALDIAPTLFPTSRKTASLERTPAGRVQVSRVIARPHGSSASASLSICFCASSHCRCSSATDFCLYAPRVFGTVGDNERDAVAWCTKSGRGTRTIPNGTLQGVHFVRTPEYVQISGVGDFTQMNIPDGDAGGELDNKGADGKGNPSEFMLVKQDANFFNRCIS